MKKRVIAFLAALFISGCAADIPPYTEHLFAMDTIMSITAYGSEQAVTDACDRIYELEKKLSAVNENSEIYSVNNSGGRACAVSDETAEIIESALSYSERTGGSIDISVYPLVREWGFTAGAYKVPSDEIINELKNYVDYRNISVSGNEITLPENGMIDLGAVAKGYASDAVKAVLLERGVTSAIINLGGNVMAVGSKPDGSSWTVAVADPYAPDDYICTISAVDTAVITSGNYQRYFIADDGTRCCHIIDPKTGKPADSGIVSATIIGGSGIMCDALSTAVFVMGADEAEKLWCASEDFEMIIITDSGEMLITDGIYESVNVRGDKDIKVRVLKR